MKRLTIILALVILAASRPASVVPWAADEPARTTAPTSMAGVVLPHPSATSTTRRVSPEDAPDRTSGHPASSAAGNPALLRGEASWYPASGMVAAAGPRLRRFLGHDWRGARVLVCAQRCVVVELVDWMRRHDRLVDLSDDAFVRLAPLSVGVIRVTIRAVIAPPATDAEP